MLRFPLVSCQAYYRCCDKRTQGLSLLALKADQGLDHIGPLVKEHQLKAVIDGPHPLEDVTKRIRYFGEGKHPGKVVIVTSR